MKKMKKIIAAALSTMLLVTALAGCGAGNQSSETSAVSDQVESTEATSNKVRVGVLSIDDSLPVFAAEQEGAFEAAGLDVEIFQFKSSSDQSKAMEAGELDVVMNDMIVQSLMKKAETNTKIIATAFGANPSEGRFVVVAAPDSGIEKPEDLEGKRIAISTNTMMEYLLNQYEKYYELNTDDIELVNMPDLMLRVETLLAGKDIDAAILPDPLASYAIAQGGIAVIDDTTLDENFSQSVYLATDAFIADNKDTLDAFMEVLQNSMKDINENPDKYRALALDKANVPEVLKDSYPMPTFTPGVVPTEQEVARVQDWLVSHDLLSKVNSYADLVDTTYVAK